MSLVTLGPVDFAGFETPGSIKFGGGQKLAVHKLLGGDRIIDVLGRDDAVISWTGTLSGTAAAQRARDLDEIRVAGSLQRLSWDAFCYLVIVSSLKLDFRNPWWIPYEIVCVVQRDLSQVSSANTVPDVTTLVMSDVTVAAQVASGSIPASLESALTGAGWITANKTVLMAQIVASSITLESYIASAGDKLSTSSFELLSSTTGALGQCCRARGFLGRALRNLESWEG